jgi:hypothetical protein
MRYRTKTGTSESANVVDVGVSVTSIDFNPDKFHPFFYHMPKVEWAVVGTVTWSRASRRWDSPESSKGRKYDFDGVFHRTCVQLGLRGRSVGIYHATEFGASGECHIHFLVARDGLKHVTPEKFGRMFKHQWCEEFRPYHRVGEWAGFVSPGVGKAEVEPYDPTYGQRGVAYCLKRELDGHGREQERYDYLSRKLIQTILRASAPQVVVAALPPRTS